jgi:5-methylcytosine-specific restriction endonuclease McrA
MALGKNQQPRISREDIEASVKQCINWSQLARELKGDDSWGHVRTLKRYVAYYKIDTSHFLGQSVVQAHRPKLTPEQLFVENSPGSNTVLAKFYRRLFPATHCEECGIGTIWNGKPLTLHIDHRNGHGTDWRLENCRYLCPNCHYQTETHGTKRGMPSRASEIKVTPLELSESFDEHKCYKTVGSIYGLSDRTVKNTIRKYRRYTSE